MNSTVDERFDYDVFISYSHADKQWVKEQLIPRLQDEKLKVCVDYRDFRPGSPSVKEMCRAVERSRKTMLVLTPNYLNSAWGEFERLMLQTNDPANQRRRLIPVLREKCDLPLEIEYLTHIDFTDPLELDIAWARLIDALLAEVSPQPPAQDRAGKLLKLLQEATFDSELAYAIKSWLSENSAHPVWGHMWKGLIELDRDDLELVQIGKIWLCEQPGHAQWPVVWEYLFDFLASYDDYISMGKTWLSENGSHGKWIDVYQRLFENNPDDPELDSLKQDRFRDVL
jgi:hypothetical protein